MGFSENLIFEYDEDDECMMMNITSCNIYGDNENSDGRMRMLLMKMMMNMMIMTMSVMMMMSMMI